MRTISIGNRVGHRPPNYPPGTIRCQHCERTFPRKNGKPNCPYCKKPHGNQQAR
jgi:rubrerythrin